MSNNIWKISLIFFKPRYEFLRTKTNFLVCCLATVDITTVGTVINVILKATAPSLYVGNEFACFFPLTWAPARGMWTQSILLGESASSPSPGPPRAECGPSLSYYCG